MDCLQAVNNTIPQTASENIISQLGKRNSILERMFTIESFTAAFASTALAGRKLTTSDMQIVLKYLQRDKGVLVKSGDVRGHCI